MSLTCLVHAQKASSYDSWAWTILLSFMLCVSTPSAFAQFSSTSDGSCGAYDLTGTPSGTIVFFIPGNFPKCDHLANNVFDFTYITIPSGVTVTLTSWDDNAPVYWLATGPVDIEGTLNLAGNAGGSYTTDPEDVRIPPAAGSGGYTGGVGGSSSQAALPGSGPGGGSAGNGGLAGSGTFTGNNYLVPLVGGSGGGGGGSNSATFGPGGGSGGGAILIASSTQITVNGTINANGGAAGNNCSFCGINNAGGGSGGAIHLVSSTINGAGEITAGGSSGGGPGLARLEAYTISFTGSFAGTPYGESVPFSNSAFAQTIPTVPPPSLQVTSVNGQAITEYPFGFPDITINTDQPVPVVITGHNVPLGTIPMVTILGDSADQDALPCAGGLAGTLATSTCTMNVTFAFGGRTQARWSRSRSKCQMGSRRSGYLTRLARTSPRSVGLKLASALYR